MRGAWSFEIGSTWDGHPVGSDEAARVALVLGDRIELRVDAAYHGDPAPGVAPGPVARLWEHEVVELFLLGRSEVYLEVELGPHGHHLGLWLEGRRRVLREGLPIDFAARIGGGRWQGVATLSRRWLPPGAWAANAYAIHGTGRGRRYLAAFPAPGDAPDFHRLERFPALAAEGFRDESPS